MSTESEEIKQLLSSTGSELYKQIGLYLHELEFTSDILVEDGDFADLFAEAEDCERIGIPSDNNSKLKHFILSRSELMIKEYTQNKSKESITKAFELKNLLTASNSDVYKKIGLLLYEHQVHSDDINQVDDLKIFLNKANCVKLGLKNAAKQKLAFRKVLRMINDTQKQQQIATKKIEHDHENETLSSTTPEPTESIKEQTNEPNNNKLLTMLDNDGNISADSFWSHFFAEVTICFLFMRFCAYFCVLFTAKECQSSNTKQCN